MKKQATTSFKSCKGCEFRTVEPNCHMTCETYLAWKERWSQGKADEYKIYCKHLARYANSTRKGGYS